MESKFVLVDPFNEKSISNYPSTAGAAKREIEDFINRRYKEGYVYRGAWAVNLGAQIRQFQVFEKVSQPKRGRPQKPPTNQP